MIKLTRLNGTEFLLNAEMIKFVESCPDTIITLCNGETLMARETVDETVKRILTYHQTKSLVPKQRYAPCDLELNAIS